MSYESPKFTEVNKSEDEGVVVGPVLVAAAAVLVVVAATAAVAVSCVNDEVAY